MSKLWTQLWGYTTNGNGLMSNCLWEGCWNTQTMWTSTLYVCMIRYTDMGMEYICCMWKTKETSKQNKKRNLIYIWELSDPKIKPWWTVKEKSIVYMSIMRNCHWEVMIYMTTCGFYLKNEKNKYCGIESNLWEQLYENCWRIIWWDEIFMSSQFSI